jgi:hypothetical protein
MFVHATYWMWTQGQFTVPGRDFRVNVCHTCKRMSWRTLVIRRPTPGFPQ